MFGKKEESAQAFNMQTMNTIGVGTSIDGNMMSDGDIRIDGKIKGNIVTSGRLVVGQTGEVLGDVRCQNGNLDGKVKGNIIVAEVLKLTKTASVDGVIKTQKIVVEEGAVIEAQISMA
ncbi:MAG: polymer-forming cytoskeletal protein [Bacteroidetes bacterium]|nr:polymer-forming cytoskeletal protein [Bacteroidota bacterium]